MMNDRCVWQAEWVIPSEIAEGCRVLEEILESLSTQAWVAHDIYSVRLALDEAIVNAIKHGNRLDENKRVRIACKLGTRQLWIEIADEGPGFNPADVPDCTCDENLEVPSGRGLMLMRCFMSRVEYNQRGNCVVMEKERCDQIDATAAEDTPPPASPAKPGRPQGKNRRNSDG